MKIKITKENEIKLYDEIEKAEGPRVKERRLKVWLMIKVMDEFQNRLDQLMYKKDQNGIEVRIDVNAQHFPGAYKWAPESTVFWAKKTASGWYLADVKRWDCRADRYTFCFSDELKAKIADFVIDPKNWNV